MFQTIPAIIDPSGKVTLLEPLKLDETRRALVTVLSDEKLIAPNETALLSEAALADWNLPEEDAAWAHLQPVK